MFIMTAPNTIAEAPSAKLPSRVLATALKRTAPIELSNKERIQVYVESQVLAVSESKVSKTNPVKNRINAVPISRGNRLTALSLIVLVIGPKPRVAFKEKNNVNEIESKKNPMKYA